ncbi:MAG: hypothetical protein JJ863_25760 [Deltaproteobacteria bacterium]|nr:hypothetical protein [Deltaproteobacteria bacterium]
MSSPTIPPDQRFHHLRYKLTHKVGLQTEWKHYTCSKKEQKALAEQTTADLTLMPLAQRFEYRADEDPDVYGGFAFPAPGDILGWGAPFTIDNFIPEETVRFVDGAFHFGETRVAGDFATYLDQALDSGFAQYWQRPESRLANGLTPAEVFARVLALPDRLTAHVTVTEVEEIPEDQVLPWHVEASIVPALAKALKCDPTVEAVVERLRSGKGLAAKKTLSELRAPLEFDRSTKGAKDYLAALTAEPMVRVRATITDLKKKEQTSASNALLDLLAQAPGPNPLTEVVSDGHRFGGPRTGLHGATRSLSKLGARPADCDVVFPKRFLPEKVVAGSEWDAAAKLT